MLLYAIAVIILLVAVSIISYPLVFQMVEPYQLASLPPTDFSERDALLDAIDELEHAFHSGKLSQADYQAQRSSLEVQYIAVLEQVEAKGESRSRPT